MANIIPFAESNVPAFLSDTADFNSDMTAHASQAFPVISIKGKVFTIVRGEDRVVLPNPKDPDSPATNILVAMIKVSPHKSKTYYRNGYSESAEDNKPTCFSNDGKLPDPSVAEPQCKSCAACKWNVFGTARGADGGFGKGKACSDFVKIVVASTDELGTPFLMRVPPASIKNLGDYGTLLTKRKLPYQGVVTKISFDKEQATPRLIFQPAGFLDEASYKEVVELSKSEQVSRMINGNSAPEEAVVAAPLPKAQKSKSEVIREQTADDIIATAMKGELKSEPVKEATVVSDGSLGDALSSIGFD
jgi:hypothetical protein